MSLIIFLGTLLSIQPQTSNSYTVTRALFKKQTENIRKQRRDTLWYRRKNSGLDVM